MCSKYTVKEFEVKRFYNVNDDEYINRNGDIFKLNNKLYRLYGYTLYECRKLNKKVTISNLIFENVSDYRDIICIKPKNIKKRLICVNRLCDAKLKNHKKIKTISNSKVEEGFECEGFDPSLVNYLYDTINFDQLKKDFAREVASRDVIESCPVPGEIQRTCIREFLTQGGATDLRYGFFFNAFGMRNVEFLVPNVSSPMDFVIVIMQTHIFIGMWNQLLQNIVAASLMANKPLKEVMEAPEFEQFMWSTRTIITNGLRLEHMMRNEEFESWFLETADSIISHLSEFRAFKDNDIPLDFSKIPNAIAVNTCEYALLYDAEGTTQSVVKPEETFVSSVLSYVQGVFAMIGGGMHYVYDKVRDWVVSLFDSFVDWMTNSLRNTVYNYWSDHIDQIKTFGMCIGVVIAFVCGFISGSIAGNVLASLSGKTFVAEGSTRDSMSIITMFIVVLSQCFPQTSIALQTMRDFTTMMNFSGSLTKTFVSLISVLPLAVQSIIAKCFGDRKEIYRHEASEIALDWTALKSVSYNTSVYQTEEYVDSLAALLSRICSLFDRARDGDLPPATMSMLSRISSECSSLYGQLGAGLTMPRIRPFPFWVHFYGAPGIGKSVLIKKIIESAPGRMTDPHDLTKYKRVNNYYRSTADQYWSCYSSNYQITTIDEYLNCNSLANAEKMIVETLSICSCSPYTLPMPAIESTRVGMKGQQFESTMLITCNNTSGFPVVGDLGNGLKRRRNLLVYLTPSDEYKQYYKDNRWEIPKDVEKYMKPYDNVKFNVLCNGEFYSVTGLERFLELLWDKQGKFAEISHRVLGETYEHKSPEQQIHEAKMKVRGIPLKEKESFSAEGPESLISTAIQGEIDCSKEDSVFPYLSPLQSGIKKDQVFAFLYKSEADEFASGLRGTFPGVMLDTLSTADCTESKYNNKSTDVFDMHIEKSYASIVIPTGFSGVISLRPFRGAVSLCVNHNKQFCHDPRCTAHFYLDNAAYNIFKKIENTLFKKGAMPGALWENPKSLSFYLMCRYFGIFSCLPKLDTNGHVFVLKNENTGICPRVWYDGSKHRFISYADGSEHYSVCALGLPLQKGRDQTEAKFKDAQSVGSIDKPCEMLRAAISDDVPSVKTEEVDSYSISSSSTIDDDSLGERAECDEGKNEIPEDNYKFSYELTLESLQQRYDSMSLDDAVSFVSLVDSLKYFSEAEEKNSRAVSFAGAVATDEQSSEYYQRLAKDALKYTLCISGVIGGLYLLYKLVSPIVGHRVDDTDFELEDDYDAANGFLKARPLKKPNGDTDKPMTLLGKSDSEGKQVVVVTMESDGVKFKAVPIMDKVFLTYSHGLQNLMRVSGIVVKLELDGKEYYAHVNPEDVVIKPNHDYCVFKADFKKINQFPNIINLIADDKVINSLERRPMGYPVTFSFDEEVVGSKARYLKQAKYRINGKEHVFKDCSLYAAQSFKGCCGTPILLGDYSNGICMIGIHVAGSVLKGGNAHGICQNINRRSVLEMIDMLSFQSNTNVLTGLDDEEFEAQSLEVCGPNLNSVQTSDTAIYVPSISEYKPSPLRKDLESFCDRAPSIVSDRHPLAEGRDPLQTGLQELASWEPPKIDVERLNDVAEDMKVFVKKHIDYKGYDRQLTMEEAVGGIPGVLNGMKVSSSLGYPLCKEFHHGKSELITLNPGAPPTIAPRFREEVALVANKIKAGEIDDYFRYCAYPKSELQKLSKISAVNTRVIYAGNAALVCYSRMRFGSLLVGFMNSGPSLSLMGINQYSKDLQVVFDYLTEVIPADGLSQAFIAGDLKKMDQHYIPEFQLKAYEILYEALPESVKAEVTREEFDNFVKTQVSPIVEYKGMNYHFNVAHLSGCCFTTIVNNIVLSLYMRYMFSIAHPELVFDDEVRMVMQGDDHVICVNRDNVFRFNQLFLEHNMSKLGQVYTNETKNEESVDEFRYWEDISILGAHPFLFEDFWVGRLRKSTIYNTLSWYRSELVNWRQAAISALEMASLWSHEFFDSILALVNEGMSRVGYPPILMSYGIRRVVASRTACLDYENIYEAESLTNFSTEAAMSQENVNISDPVEGGGFGGIDDDLNLGLDSFLYKESFEWDMNSEAGTLLYKPTTGFPKCLLNESLHDLQYSKFKSFMFYRSDFEIRIQLNGNKMQQGALCVFFQPLNNQYEITYKDWLTLPHVIVEPKGSCDYVFKIPYRHMYPFLPTHGDYSLGALRIGVLSPLSYTSGTPVTVSLYLRFDNYMFNVPIPSDYVAEGFDMEFEAEGEEVVKNEPTKEEVVKPSESVSEPAKPAPPPVDRENKPKTMFDQKKDSTNKKFYRYKRNWKKANGANGKKTVNGKPQGVKVAKGGKASKKGGRKFFGKTTQAQRAKASWDAYLKKYGQPPACTPGQIVYAHKKGWMKVDGKTGAIIEPPKNMCQSLLGDMVCSWVAKTKKGLKAGGKAIGKMTSELADVVDEVDDVFLSVDDVCDALGFFDNPNVSKVIEPVQISAPSMSNVSGEYYAKNMDLHPVSNYKPGRFVMDPVEMNLDFLMSREGIVGDFAWGSDRAINTELLSINLNSLLGGKMANTVPLFALNQFQFFHCDFMFRLYVFKTMFHTGRIRAVLGYGFTEDDFPDNARNTCMSRVLDFDAETDYVDFLVPWACVTDYLRTWDGPRNANQTYLKDRDFSLGVLRLEVANKLCLANDSVPMSVECLLTVRLVDARVAVPKVIPMTGCTNLLTETNVNLSEGFYMTVTYSTGTATQTTEVVEEFEAEGDLTMEAGEELDEVISAPDDTVDDFMPDESRVEESVNGFSKAHNNLDIGAQFEFLPGNVLDVARRFVELPKATAGQFSGSYTTEDLANQTQAFFYIRPMNSPLTNLYRGYSGGITLRIVSETWPLTLYWCPSCGKPGEYTVPGRPDLTTVNFNRKLNTTTTQYGTIKLTPTFGSVPTPPIEILLPSGNTNGFVDVVLPYQQHTFFVTPETNYNMILGTVCISGKMGLYTTRVYQKVADDGSFGIFCPPRSYQLGVKVQSNYDSFGVNGYFL